MRRRPLTRASSTPRTASISDRPCVACDCFHHARAAHVHQPPFVARKCKGAHGSKVVSECITVSRARAKQYRVGMQIDLQLRQISAEQPFSSRRNCSNCRSAGFHPAILAGRTRDGHRRPPDDVRRASRRQHRSSVYLAQSGHDNNRAEPCPLSGVKRTSVPVPRSPFLTQSEHRRLMLEKIAARVPQIIAP